MGSKKKVTTTRILQLLGLITFGMIIIGISTDLNNLSETVWQSVTASLTSNGNIHNAATFTDEKCIIMRNAIRVQLNGTSEPDGATDTLASIYCNSSNLQAEFAEDLNARAKGVVAWACSVALETIKDQNSRVLRPYVIDYCESAILEADLQIERYNELASKLMGTASSDQIDQGDQLIEEADEMISNNEVYQAHLKLREALNLLNNIHLVDE